MGTLRMATKYFAHKAEAADGAEDQDNGPKKGIQCPVVERTAVEEVTRQPAWPPSTRSGSTHSNAILPELT